MVPAVDFTRRDANSPRLVIRPGRN